MRTPFALLVASLAAEFAHGRRLIKRALSKVHKSNRRKINAHQHMESVLALKSPAKVTQSELAVLRDTVGGARARPVRSERRA